MLTDAFDDFRLFGKQQFRLIFAGGHRFEIGGFTVVEEYRREKWRNNLQHFLSSWPVVGSEQRIEKSFEFFLVQRLESIHVIRAEVVVHGAGEENCKFAEQVGVVVQSSARKAK